MKKGTTIHTGRIEPRSTRLPIDQYVKTFMSVVVLSALLLKVKYSFTHFTTATLRSLLDLKLWKILFSLENPFIFSYLFSLENPFIF